MLQNRIGLKRKRTVISTRFILVRYLMMAWDNDFERVVRNDKTISYGEEIIQIPQIEEK